MDEIVRLLLKRDESALTQMKTQYGGLCRHIIASLLTSVQDTEEALSDVWLNVWNSIPPAKPKHLRAYLAKLLATQRCTTSNAIMLKSAAASLPCWMNWRNVSPTKLPPTKWMRFFCGIRSIPSCAPCAAKSAVCSYAGTTSARASRISPPHIIAPKTGLPLRCIVCVPDCVLFFKRRAMIYERI